GRCLLRQPPAHEPARRLGLAAVAAAGLARRVRGAPGRGRGALPRPDGAASAGLERHPRGAGVVRVLVRRQLPSARALVLRARRRRPLDQADAATVTGVRVRAPGAADLPAWVAMRAALWPEEDAGALAAEAARWLHAGADGVF